MSDQIVFSPVYEKKASQFLKRYPHLRNQYQKTLELLKLNFFHPSLRPHKLQGKLKGLYSVSINLSYRITFDFIIENQQIVPFNIGDHSVYS
ncbi:MAG: type II toxin-antitoxin system RelE/ParE family toxin [Gammaproteobacteria bacterium]|nr:type II toxin-antitoxin system RelE/ParE family toxin [Gammaproteobacteria bacterium]